MNHADTLKLLFPVEITGDFAADIALEGAHLNNAQASADMLLLEIFPDAAYKTLADWERVCGLIPAVTDTIEMRRDAVIQKLCAKGGLSRKYFIDLAASLGWTITITELNSFMASWHRCGDKLYVVSARWSWQVNVFSAVAYMFRAGISCAGERLGYWKPTAQLETLFNELKPAHTFVIYKYY